MALRFCVLHHTGHPTLADHFDLMIEPASGAALLTWRLASWPPAGDWMPATSLPDHRRVYLEFEGALSGDRGSVRRVDGGGIRLMRHEAEIVRAELIDKQTTLHLRRESADHWLIRVELSEPIDR